MPIITRGTGLFCEPPRYRDKAYARHAARMKLLGGVLTATVAARGVPSRQLRDVVMHERNHAHFFACNFFTRLCCPTRAAWMCTCTLQQDRPRLRTRSVRYVPACLPPAGFPSS